MRRMHWELIAEHCHKAGITRRRARAIYQALYHTFEQPQIDKVIRSIKYEHQASGNLTQAIERLDRYADRVALSMARHEERFINWVLHGAPKHRRMSLRTQAKVDAILRRHKVKGWPSDGRSTVPSARRRGSRRSQTSVASTCTDRAPTMYQGLTPPFWGGTIPGTSSVL